MIIINTQTGWNSVLQDCHDIPVASCQLLGSVPEEM